MGNDSSGHPVGRRHLEFCVGKLVWLVGIISRILKTYLFGNHAQVFPRSFSVNEDSLHEKKAVQG